MAYKCDKIEYTNLKEHPIIVSMTTWLLRLKYVEKAINYLKNQTLLPDLIILWISTDEIKKEQIPLSLIENPYIQIRYVDKNLYVWKRYITILQHPEAYVIFCDDDFYYYDDYIKDLMNCANLHNNYGLICTACNKCTPGGLPWAGLMGYKSTNYNWVAGGAAMYCPNTFPMEAFDYYELIMDSLPLQCDECFMMPFIYYHKIPIYTVDDNWDHFFALTKFIDDSLKNALHDKFFTDNNWVRTNIKNKLLLYICNSLPKEYKEEFIKIFPDLGKN